LYVGNEIFKLVSLRAPVNNVSIDPSLYVRGSLVLRLLDGIRVNTESPQPEVLAKLQGLRTLTNSEVSSMILENLAKQLQSIQAWTFQALFEVKILAGTESMTIKEIAIHPQFSNEYMKVFDSWLIHRITDPRNNMIPLYERLLRGGYLSQHLFHSPNGLNEPGDIRRLLDAHCKLPSMWSRLNSRTTDLRARHIPLLKNLAQVNVSDMKSNILQKQQRWRKLVSEIAEVEAIRSQAFKEFSKWNTKEAADVGRVAEPRERTRLLASRLDERFFGGLANRLNERQRTILSKVIERRPPGSAVDLDDLIGDLDTKVLTADANEVCHEIRALEEQEQNRLPVASHQPQDNLQPFIKGIGWGELVVARERLIGYKASEIAHIENILPGETKIRRHERTSTTEEITETETITEKESERDSQTTDRFELQNQSQEAIQQNFSIQAGLNTSGRYGLTHVDTNLNTGFQQSKSESRGSAQNLSKEIVSRAVERTFESVRKLRRLTISEQIRELNRHELSNVQASGATSVPTSISGAYLWLEKVHQVELRHYGTRLMIEFHIPEPAVSLLEHGESKKTILQLPPFELGPQDINAGNYLCKAQQFRAQDVEPPPAQFINVGYSWATAPSEESDEWAEDTVSDTIAIPDGYRPVEGTAVVSAIKMGEEDVNIHLIVAGIDVITQDETAAGDKRDTFQFDPSLTWPNGVPVSVRARGHFDKAMVAQVVLRCERTNEVITKWQLSTWEKLRAGYEVLLRRVDREGEMEAHARAVFGNIAGRAEGQNRLIEQDEFQKWAIKAMRLQSYNFNAIEQVGDFQEISPLNADMQSPIVKFFEEAFEWKQVSYFLYPYFWARRETWKMRNNISSTDPRHAAFLKAGAARLIVPVTPGYEAKVLYYLESDINKDELLRIDGPPSEEMPSGTGFEDLWLELLTERRAEVVLGSGSLAVTQGSDSARINEDSNWHATEERDLGREIYVGGGVYTVKAVPGEREVKLDRSFEETSDPFAKYATGSMPYGQPWLVNVPTSLIILDDNRSRLESLP
jgi:hypothetical protein